MALGIAYRPELYLGESINRKKLDKIKKRLENRPLFSGVFLIAFSRNPSDQLEIYEAKQLSQSYYQKYPPYIVGIAGSRQEAVALVEKIVKECLSVRGDCALKEYLRC
ncbi:hypothetical protein NSB25_21350 [Acetatifactor muris]|jgi:hypothetical protein|uniref:Uncharacterized protein n=1 Tax=Acetatifactor muris TaxID=879566 RepID=A0A2K4ZM07_9FIRM|nr:hypothetical protein [Acetatifactor muris]MCI8800663.1 hypothetical protein [Lachnospiraceae bacterium]MCR2049806.1 hypothetical protein [Acetatifactor muris]SOY31519.1 hypothetical protein AMURIS_04263 [Acetatifactor muris]